MVQDFVTSQRAVTLLQRSATSPACRVLLCLPDLRLLLLQQEAETELWVCRKLQNRLLNLRFPADDQSSFLVIDRARLHGNTATFTSTDLAPLKTRSNGSPPQPPQRSLIFQFSNFPKNYFCGDVVPGARFMRGPVKTINRAQ